MQKAAKAMTELRMQFYKDEYDRFTKEKTLRCSRGPLEGPPSGD